MLGRPWPAPGEPLWLPEDAEYAMAWVEDQQQLCPGGCGQYQQDALDPASEGHWTTTAVRCHACAARGRELERFEDRRGLLSSVSRDPIVRPVPDDLRGD